MFLCLFLGVGGEVAFSLVWQSADLKHAPAALDHGGGGMRVAHCGALQPSRRGESVRRRVAEATHRIRNQDNQKWDRIQGVAQKGPITAPARKTPTNKKYLDN